MGFGQHIFPRRGGLMLFFESELQGATARPAFRGFGRDAFPGSASTGIHSTPAKPASVREPAFSDVLNSWSYFALIQGNKPFDRNVTVVNPPFPKALSAIPPTSVTDFWAVDYQPRNPTEYSYNLTIQRELGRMLLHRLLTWARRAGTCRGAGMRTYIYYPEQIRRRIRILHMASRPVRPKFFREVSQATLDHRRL